MTDQFGENEEIQSGDPVSDRQTINMLTTAKAVEGAKIEQTGWIFDLNATLDGEGKPQQAVVRRVTIADTQMIKSLPQHVQQKLTSLLDEQAFEQSKAENSRGHKGARKKMTTKILVNNLEDGMEIADIMCVAGFIDPKVYLTEEEAEQHSGVWVGHIHKADRLAFNRVCQADQEAIADRLRPFLGGPIIDVPSVAAGPEFSAEVPQPERSDQSERPMPTMVGSYESRSR